MAIAPSVLMVELIMSADRVIQAAEKVEQAGPSPEGEWGAQVILGHLSQVDEEVWLHRINLMVDAQGNNAEIPSFVWWEPDPVATEVRFGAVSVQDAGAELMSTRTKLLTRLRDLSETDWTAKARHDTFGEITITELLLEMLGHDEEHRATLVNRFKA